MKLVFYPVFDDAAALTDHFFRLHWYSHPFRSEISEIVLARNAPEIAVGEIPDYLDPGLAALVGERAHALVIEPPAASGGFVQ